MNPAGLDLKPQQQRKSNLFRLIEEVCYCSVTEFFHTRLTPKGQLKPGEILSFSFAKNTNLIVFLYVKRSKHVFEKTLFLQLSSGFTVGSNQGYTKEMQKNDYPLQKDRFGKRGPFLKIFELQKTSSITKGTEIDPSDLMLLQIYQNFSRRVFLLLQCDLLFSGFVLQFLVV